MPGKSDPVSITIADETWELYKPKGMKAAIVVPKLLIIASEIIFTATRANIDLSGLMNEEGFNLSALSSGVLPAARSIAIMLADKWELVEGLLPILLCKDREWLEENGEPYEYLRALWTALNFQIPGIIGPEQWASLKKSYSEAAEEEETEDTTTD